MSIPGDVVRLQELIDALDRRQVQPQRAQEPAIAQDALQMRARAVARLRELQNPPPPPED